MFATRDLAGYGSTPPNPNWPNKARIAVSFVLNYEEGGENTPLNQDSHSEVFLNETPGSQPQTQRDMNMESQYEYGSRVGVWRIMHLFEERGWKFTCYAVGRAVELNPAPVQAMHAAGHEIACHNYRWINYAALSEAEERKHVLKGIEAIQSAIGQPPAGWYTGRISANSRQIVIEEFKKLGLPLLYDSDSYSDDLPYYLPTLPTHLVIPYTLDSNDMKFCVPPGFTSPDGFFVYLKDAFDCLRREGGKMLNIGLHARIVGRPGRVEGLRRFMEYVAQFDDVWVCTREEMARHWRAEFPPAGDAGNGAKANL
ncbi:hypothetical protein HDU98_010317 [Podochytrium sp. JEL0797]|nr:hypothetical protein HDU98_010317 [Podochytrium sp. JEL0797]